VPGSRGRNAVHFFSDAGSGGAIIGTYEDEAMFDRLRQSLAAIGSLTIKPQVE